MTVLGLGRQSLYERFFGDPVRMRQALYTVMIREHAVLTYRGRGVEIELPTLCTPSWFAESDAASATATELTSQRAG